MWPSETVSTADTMLMAYLLNPNLKDFSLRKMCLEHLGRRLDEGEKQHSLIGDERPANLCQSAIATIELYRVLSPEIESRGLSKLFLEVETPLVPVLAEMERQGVKVDTDQLRQMSGQLGKEIDKLAQQIFTVAGQEFNLNSPRQLAEVLFEKLGLPTSKKTGKAGHYSTGVEVLEDLAARFEIAQLILDYRELTKLKSTYLDALPELVKPETGRIHTSYNQMVAATGRLSSSNPNLQNIPVRSKLGRETRRAFVAESGFRILAVDYSQIELRVMAHLSGDPVLTEAFRRGEDIHQRTAQEVFGIVSGRDDQEMRRRAKVINFGIMYGLSAFGLAKSLKIDQAEAKRYIKGYFERYRGVRDWTERIVEEARNEGQVKTLFGRIRPIPEINSPNWNIREFAKRTAVNAPIQGTAADLIKMAMIAISRRLREENLRSRLIMQVHDELVFEVRISEIDYLRQVATEEMEGVTRLSVPLRVDLGLGRSWYEAK
jgi:DNA polymerase-1